jgi:Na+/melibiose symporter-like transporter
MLVYSANNIPYSALSGVITGDQKERSSLFSVRFVFVTIAILAIQGFAFPMVNYFGSSVDPSTGKVFIDSAKGFMVTMGIFSVLAVIFFFATFSWTKERIKPNPEQKQSLKQDISDLIHNRPWVVMFLVFTVMFIFLAIRNGMLRYYFLYYMDMNSMTNFINSLNGATAGLMEKLNFAGEKAFIPDSVFSLSNILGQFAAILGIVVSNILLPKLGKKNTFMFGLALAALSVLLFYFVSPTAVGLAIILQVFYNFAWGITMPVPWAMMADVADFSDWKFNRRSTAIVFAGIVIGLKVGLAIGGALSSMFLKWYGYVAPAPKENWAVQTQQTINGIQLSNSLFLAILIVAIMVFLFFYQISKSMELKMQDELAERRKAMNS